MTYVTEQTSQELRAHMRRLKAMAGWHEPLADRLYKEILELDAQLKAKVVEAEPLHSAKNGIPCPKCGSFGRCFCPRNRQDGTAIKPPIGAQE